MSGNNDSDQKCNNKGDAESGNYSKSFGQNIPSIKAKPEESTTNRAGPFGDSPPDSISNNYYLLMMGDSDENGPLDEDDQLMKEYLLRINAIQERLQMVNFIELDDPRSRNYENGRMSAKGCKITEILSDEGAIDSNRSRPSTRKLSGPNPKPERCSSKMTSVSKDLSEYIAAKEMLYPPTDSSNSMNTSSVSSANSGRYKPSFDFSKKYDTTSEHFEMDYNPPKKKQCFRENSPKVHSISSEAYMKYPFFKKNNEQYSARTEHRKLLNMELNENSDLNDDSKELECEQSTVMEEKSEISQNTHIFPNVIVKTSEHSQEGSARYAIEVEGKLIEINGDSRRSSSISYDYISYSKSDDISSQPSPKSDNTRRSYTTSVSSPTKKSRTGTAKSSVKNKIDTTEKMSLWEEIRKTKPPNDYDELDYDMISETCEILKPEVNITEQKSSIPNLVTNCLRKHTKKSTELAYTASNKKDSRGSSYIKNSERQISSPRNQRVTEFAAEARIPSTLLESFRKSQQTTYNCYSASSHSTKSDDNIVDEPRNRFWNVCSCFCNPFNTP